MPIYNITIVAPDNKPIIYYLREADNYNIYPAQEGTNLFTYVPKGDKAGSRTVDGITTESLKKELGEE